MSSVVWIWILFATIFIGVSALDLFVITHRHTPVGVKSALRWTALWIGLALAFGVVIYLAHPQGRELGPLYLTGYLTEYSLSVDNLFVFILIFAVMGVPPAAQPKLIKLGIFLSIALRIGFILFGVSLLQRVHGLLYVFGGVLIWTAAKMIAANEAEPVRPERNVLYRLASRWLPLRIDVDDSRRLLVHDRGRWCITPLFLVFLVIGSTDILFALDSIPAIMGISQDPFVLITSNVFAVLGLNALFFAIRGIIGAFRYLKHGVSLILLFIGAKMIAGIFAPVEHWFKAHALVSLGVIGGVLVVSIAASMWHNRHHRATATPLHTSTSFPS